MKIKLETSPWKDDFETIQDYIAAIKNCLDIDLDPENLAPNPGKQDVAKMRLNSLWGKFGQRQNMTQTEYVTDVKKWYNFCWMIDSKLVTPSLLMILCFK
jgi:hypothetical protein